MSDRSALLSFLTSMPGVIFVPPHHNFVVEQAEVHNTAREEIARRGLPKDHPYCGWHTQANAFDTSRMLVRGQRIYFGGDREAVAGALAPLHDLGYVVLGGTSDQDSFIVYRAADPTVVEPAQADAWADRLAILVDDHAVELRDGEEALLHDLIADPPEPSLLPMAALALRMRNLVTSTDLDLLLRRTGDLDKQLTPVVVLALNKKHPMAEQTAAALAADGRAESEIFEAWGPAGIIAAKEAAVTMVNSPRVYLDLVVQTGGDPLAAAIDIIERRRDAGASATALGYAAHSVVQAITGGSWHMGAAMATIRDFRVPGWVKLVVADDYTGEPWGPHAVAALAVDRKDFKQWPDLVDELRASEGLPPGPGYDLDSRSAQQAAIEERAFMIERHLDGMRAALHSPALSEPAAAVLLEILHGAGLLRRSDLEPLMVGWRKRWFRKPDPYTPAPPAMLSLTVAAHTLDHEKAGDLLSALAKDSRRWSEASRMLVQAALPHSPEEHARLVDVTREAAFSGDGHASQALALLEHQERDCTPAEAALQLLLEAPESPKYVRNQFVEAAIRLHQPGTVLRTDYLSDFSLRDLEATVDLGLRDNVPREAREECARILRDATALKTPANPMHERRPIIPTPEEIAVLHARIEHLEDLLA